MKKLGLYYLFVVVLVFVCPVGAAVFEVLFAQDLANFSSILFKWFVFFGVGLRLFTAGLKQAIQPEFTARDIFGLLDEACYPLIREIGMANLCFGLIGILSVVSNIFLLPAAFSGGLYFGLVGMLHLFKPKTKRLELFRVLPRRFLKFVNHI